MSSICSKAASSIWLASEAIVWDFFRSLLSLLKRQNKPRVLHQITWQKIYFTVTFYIKPHKQKSTLPKIQPSDKKTNKTVPILDRRLGHSDLLFEEILLKWWNAGEKSPKNFKYWKPEIPLLVILNNGFLDSKFSAFQPFPLWGEKRELAKIQWRNADMGQNMSSL